MSFENFPGAQTTTVEHFENAPQTQESPAPKIEGLFVGLTPEATQVFEDALNRSGYPSSIFEEVKDSDDIEHVRHMIADIVTEPDPRGRAERMKEVGRFIDNL